MKFSCNKIPKRNTIIPRCIDSHRYGRILCLALAESQGLRLDKAYLLRTEQEKAKKTTQLSKLKSESSSRPVPLKRMKSELVDGTDLDLTHEDSEEEKEDYYGDGDTEAERQRKADIEERRRMKNMQIWEKVEPQSDDDEDDGNHVEEGAVGYTKDEMAYLENNIRTKLTSTSIVNLDAQDCLPPAQESFELAVIDSEIKAARGLQSAGGAAGIDGDFIADKMVLQARDFQAILEAKAHAIAVAKAQEKAQAKAEYLMRIENEKKLSADKVISIRFSR